MALKDAGVYGSGVLYSDPGVIDQLRASLHVNAAGDLIYNNPTIVQDGKYAQATTVVIPDAGKPVTSPGSRN